MQKRSSEFKGNCLIEKNDNCRFCGFFFQLLACFSVEDFSHMCGKSPSGSSAVHLCLCGLVCVRVSVHSLTPEPGR